MTEFGYTMSSEEHPPRELVANAARAEAAGFDFLTISDHFHPWVQAQGHSPFVWSVLGAVASVTETIPVAVGVTCPTMRIHPVVIAQAAATTSLLFGDRFSLGLGSGEALNEHVTGARWPVPAERLARLREAVEVLRELWKGDTVDHHGPAFTVENARIFDPPDQPIPLIVSGFGSTAVKLAAEIGDGLWTSGTDPAPLDHYRQAGGTGPRYGQFDLCVGPDEAACRRTVHQVWPNGAVPGQLAQDLPTWTHFEQVAQLVTEDDATASVACGPDIDTVVAAAQKLVDAGYERVHLHQIGPDQDSLLRMWTDGLGDALHAL